MSSPGTGISIGLQSPQNTLSVSNSPVSTSVGVIEVDLAVQTSVVPGVYVNPSLEVNPQGVITSITGNTAVLNAVSLTSQAGTLNISNSTISGADPVCNLDLQPVGSSVAGVWTNPNLVVDAYGRIVAASSNPPLPGGGTVTSVGLTSVAGTMAVSQTPVISAGSLNVDLAPVSGLPSVAVPCASVGVDMYGRVTSLQGGSLTLQSPNRTLSVSQPVVTDTSMTLGVDVAPTGVTPGTYLVPVSMQVTSSGQISAIQGTTSSGIVQNITSTGGSLVVSPGGGTQGTNQCALNLDLPSNPALAGTYNGITVNPYGVVTRAVNGQYLNQINMSSPKGTLAVSNGALTQTNPSTTVDLNPVNGSPGQVGLSALTVNTYGQVTAATPVSVTSPNGTLNIQKSGNTAVTMDLKPVPNVAGTQYLSGIQSMTINNYGQITQIQQGQSGAGWYLAQIVQVTIAPNNWAFWVSSSVSSSQARGNSGNVIVTTGSGNVLSTSTGPVPYPDGGAIDGGWTSFCPDISSVRFSSSGTVEFILWPGNRGPQNANAQISCFIWVNGAPS